VNKENVVHKHSGVLLSHKENKVICRKTDETRDVKQNKPEPERQIPYFLLYVESRFLKKQRKRTIRRRERGTRKGIGCERQI
jgi:hypothetical protein